MKRRVRFAVLLLFTLALSWQAPSLRAGEDAVRPARGKALICFYREEAFQGNIFRYRLSDGETPIGSLPARCWQFYQADPGVHSFRVGLLRHSSINLRVLPDHVYYLRCDPAAEVLYARPQLEQVPVVEGASVVATMQLDLEVLQ